MDPLGKDFPWNSPYSYAENSPVACIDLDGLERVIVTSWFGKDGKLIVKVFTDDKARKNVFNIFKQQMQKGATINDEGGYVNNAAASNGVLFIHRSADGKLSYNYQSDEKIVAGAMKLLFFQSKNENNTNIEESKVTGVGVIIYGEDGHDNPNNQREDFAQRSRDKVDKVTIIDIGDITGDLEDAWPWSKKEQTYKELPDGTIKYPKAKPTSKHQAYDSISVDEKGDTTGFIFRRETNKKGDYVIKRNNEKKD